MSGRNYSYRINRQWGKELKAEMRKRLRRAALFLEGEIKKSINIPTRTQGPSRPGEPPHRDTGQLFRSIFHELQEHGDTLVAIIGTDVEHGKYHELGVRPFLKRALMVHHKRIKQILIDGK